MTNGMPKQRSLMRLFTGLAAVVVLVLVWDRWNGAFAVMSLCKHDGGERIFETTYTPGYLANETNYFCLGCVEAVGSRQFKYVDALVHFVPNGRFPSERYLRYSLGLKGHPDCETWSYRVGAKLSLRRAGVKDSECMRVNLLPTAPTGYALVNSRSKIVVRGAPIELNEWRVEKIGTRHVLARIRDYQFTSRLTALMDMSGHGGNPNETCLDIHEYAKTVGLLPTRVLGDRTKSPTH